MRQQLQQENEVGLSRQVHNHQVEPEAENASTGELEEQSQQPASSQVAALNVALTRQVVDRRRRWRHVAAAILAIGLISPLAQLIAHLMGKDAWWKEFFGGPLWLFANLLILFGFISYLIVAGERRIREAANECLPLLQERVEQLRAPHTLLRASAAENANPNILLRPTAQSGETPAEQLLRATTPEP